MAELLKDKYNLEFIKQLSTELSKHVIDFDQKAFRSAVFDKDWDQRELKERIRHVTHCMNLHINTSYEEALDILKQASHSFSG